VASIAPVPSGAGCLASSRATSCSWVVWVGVVGEADPAQQLGQGHLANDFTVLTFDMPGFSRSHVRSPDDVSVTKLADQIADLVESLKLCPATFYGCSSGGFAVLDLVDNDVRAQPRPQVILSRDYPPYAIGPHTDIPKRLASMILYLAPKQAPAEWGTSLFVPKKPGFTCSRGQHYDFANFIPSSTVAFRANRALLFARSDRSFHGLLPIAPEGGARETMLYEIVR
jgi:hypothetical protein